MTFDDIMKKTSVLMNMEKSGEISRKYGSNKKNLNDKSTKLNETIDTIVSNNYNAPQEHLKISQNSKLPKEIIDSFKKTLAEEEQKNKEMMSKIAKNVNIVSESSQKIETTNDDKENTSQSNIKELIKEAIREEISSLSLISLKDKINLVTKNGDVYEVKLEFKKNINNKK